uniref:Uncharacterized protein n=1 Tax=Helianthus annuus TaxID=4232 RepID=A0A251UJA4_HELAN
MKLTLYIYIYIYICVSIWRKPILVRKLSKLEYVVHIHPHHLIHTHHLRVFWSFCFFL